jgi:signal transduction histidine kinase
MTIRKKITALFTILTGFIILMLSLLIYHFSKQSIEKEFFHRLTVRAGIAAQVYYEQDELSTAFYNELRQKHLQRLPEEQEFFFDSIPPEEIEKILDVDLPVDFHQRLKKARVIQFIDGPTYYTAVSYDHKNEHHVVILSARNEPGEQSMADMRQILFLGIIVSMIIVFAVGVLFSAEVVSPLTTMISRVKKISASNLHMRLPKERGRSEINDLTQTFNDMLDRLETSFETQRNFVNKLSHELRTPLTAILGEAELALSAERDNHSYRQSLMIIAREADQLHNLTTSLLELAQAGNNVKEDYMGPIRLDELVISVKKLVDFTDPGNQVRINFEELPEDNELITVYGNQNLLKLAVANVVQNACKYSNNGKVTVTLRASQKHCMVIVEDQGIGIPEKELRYIFDPFFRASNTTAYKGYGVGLPLAQKIIRIHRGEIRFTSMEGAGTRAELRFPIPSILQED